MRRLPKQLFTDDESHAVAKDMIFLLCAAPEFGVSSWIILGAREVLIVNCHSLGGRERMVLSADVY
jgi:hypothetical protein